MRRTTVTGTNNPIIKRSLDLTLRLLDLDCEVVLPPLLQQFLQQIVESLGIVQTRVLGENLALRIRDLTREIDGMDDVTTQCPCLTSYHQHLAFWPQVASVAGHRQAWSVLNTLAR